MYAYFNGIIDEISDGQVYLDVNGVGWLLNVTTRFAQSHSVGDKVKLYAHLVVREDDMSLFAFESKQEKTMFLRLISVSGIGPKVALGALSTLDVQQIASALVSADAKAFARVPNIGPKTANRIILELKDKVNVEELLGTEAVPVGAVQSDASNEALTALISLGYQRNEAVRAIAAVKELADTAEEITLLALKRMGM